MPAQTDHHSRRTATPPRLKIVCPMYFDVESFCKLHDAIHVSLDGFVDTNRDASAGQGASADRFPIGSIEFFLVDDSAGRDPSVESLDPLADVTVIRPPFNLGHQRAIVYGLRSLKSTMNPDDVIVTMDADGEDRPEDLPAMVTALLQQPHDLWRVCVAQRTRRRERLSFKALYLGFRLIFRMLTGLEIRSGNFAAYRGLYARQVLPHPSFDLCYSSSLVALNPDVVKVPCPRGDRYAGESRMGTQKLLSHGVHMLMPFADRIAIRSLAFFSLTAALVVAILAMMAVSGVLGWFDMPAWAGWLLAASGFGSGLALVNFLVLFSGYAQTTAISFQRIDPSAGT